MTQLCCKCEMNSVLNFTPTCWTQESFQFESESFLKRFQDLSNDCILYWMQYTFDKKQFIPADWLSGTLHMAAADLVVERCTMPQTSLKSQSLCISLATSSDIFWYSNPHSHRRKRIASNKTFLKWIQFFKMSTHRRAEPRLVVRSLVARQEKPCQGKF